MPPLTAIIGLVIILAFGTLSYALPRPYYLKGAEQPLSSEHKQTTEKELKYMITMCNDLKLSAMKV